MYSLGPIPVSLEYVGVACLENGVAIQSDKRSGWRGRKGGRARDRGERMAGMYEPSDGEASVSDDDAMDIEDNHIVNPNEY